jgi:FAD/FMN-containing dehydrogenase
MTKPSSTKPQIPHATTQYVFYFIASLPSPDHSQCAALQSSLGSLVHLSPQPPSHASKFYAKQQQELIPACVFTPSSPQDLSTGLGIVKSYGCQFAVRSGGHGASAGWSNADGGVSIDLGGFNEVELLGSEGECEENQGIVRVGTGARWGDVYGVLLPLGISPVRGRSADVGVGGFILGG